MEWAPTFISIAGFVLMGGGVAWYCKDLGTKIEKLSDIIVQFPKEYVLKVDCSKEHNRVEDSIDENRKSFERVNESLSYLKGAQNGAKA